MRAAVVDPITNIVINMIVADPSIHPAPPGYLLIDVTNMPCEMGWIYDPVTGTFSDPNV